MAFEYDVMRVEHAVQIQVKCDVMRDEREANDESNNSDESNESIERGCDE